MCVVYIPYVSSAWEGLKKTLALDPLELELEVVLRHHMGGNQTEVLWKSSSYSSLLSHHSMRICFQSI